MISYVGKTAVLSVAHCLFAPAGVQSLSPRVGRSGKFRVRSHLASGKTDDRLP